MRIINLFKNLKSKGSKTTTANLDKPQVDKIVGSIESGSEPIVATEGNGNKGHVVGAGGNGLV